MADRESSSVKIARIEEQLSYLKHQANDHHRISEENHQKLSKLIEKNGEAHFGILTRHAREIDLINRDKKWIKGIGIAMWTFLAGIIGWKI